MELTLPWVPRKVLHLGWDSQRIRFSGWFKDGHLTNNWPIRVKKTPFGAGFSYWGRRLFPFPSVPKPEGTWGLSCCSHLVPTTSRLTRANTSEDRAKKKNPVIVTSLEHLNLTVHKARLPHGFLQRQYISTFYLNLSGLGIRSLLSIISSNTKICGWLQYEIPVKSAPLL